MELIHTAAELRARLAGATRVGVVPTMGNLHDGHIDLTRHARAKSDCVVVTIFVNRLQFGPHEDFDRYPRTLADDAARCRDAGVDVVFAPDEREMYPDAQAYMVEPPAIQHILEGAVRPGHFRGVATVVAKLFNMVRPDVAVFGKKDYQQCRVIANMVRQLNFPIELVLAETIRAADGLALSSRNGYLSAAERAEAPALHRALARLGTAAAAGERDLGALEARAAADLAARGWLPDYLTLRRRDDLLAPQHGDRELVALGAARLGATRLIDSIEVTI